jgi:hypothetical protein
MPGNKAKRKSFVLRIRPEDYEALERWAADEFRSINGQMEYLLHEALRRSGRLPGMKRERKGPSASDANKDSSPPGKGKE